MEESSSGDSADKVLADRYIIQFKAATGFTVVLEYGSVKEMEATASQIEEAGLSWERLSQFNPKFDQADLFMDMRSPVCAAQFDLEDWI